MKCIKHKFRTAGKSQEILGSLCVSQQCWLALKQFKSQQKKVSTGGLASITRTLQCDVLQLLTYTLFPSCYSYLKCSMECIIIHAVRIIYYIRTVH